MKKEIIEKFSYIIRVGFLLCIYITYYVILISLCGCSTNDENVSSNIPSEVQAATEQKEITPIHYRLYYTIGDEVKTLDFEANYNTSITKAEEYITTSDYNFNIDIWYENRCCLIQYKDSNEREVIYSDFDILIVNDDE